MNKKIILLLSLLAVVLLFFAFDLEQYLTLEYVKSQQQAIEQLYVENRVATLVGFFLIYQTKPYRQPKEKRGRRK